MSAPTPVAPVATPLHVVSAPSTMWTTANVSEAVPGLLTPLTWSLWISAQPAWDLGFNDMGVVTDEELGRELVADECNLGIFFGRAVMNVEKLRLYADRLPGGSANGAEASIAGVVRVGAVDHPDEAIRAVAIERMPVVATRYAVEMPALHAEADALWRSWTSAGTDEGTWRTVVAEGADLFRRAQRYQGMATMFLQGAFSALAALVAELGEPGAENTLVAGDAGLDENRMVASLWSVGRRELALEAFLDEFGFHGPHEGSVESWSWRERPELLDAVLAAYAVASDDQAPERVTERVAAARDAALARLLSAANAEQAATLQALTAQATALMPYRELGKATFLRGLDLVRMGARFGGTSLARSGVLASPEDVWFLTLAELLADPTPVGRADVDARRGERDSYRGITVPPVFVGQPEPVPVAEDAKVAEAGATVSGMGASPGVVEGTVRVVVSPAEPIDEGDVVVTSVTDPSWVPLFLVAGAMVVDVGGALSHATIVARELGLPCVIGTVDGSCRLRTGDRVVVDGTAGTVQVLGSVAS